MLTTKEQAAKLGCTRQRVLQLIVGKKLKAKRFGRVWQIYPGQWVEASAVGAPRGPRKADKGKRS